MIKKITCGVYLYSIPLKGILVCHATNASWKQWSIPKGLQEKDEPLWETAARELLEETGLSINLRNVTIKHKLPPIQYLKQNKILESFLVVTTDDLASFNFHCKPSTQNLVPEVNQWKWITLDQANQWLHVTQRQNLMVIKEIINTHLKTEQQTLRV